MPAARAFCFCASVHDAVMNFVKETAALWVRQDDQSVWLALFEEAADTGDRSARACAADKRVDQTARLLPNFRTCPFVVRLQVGQILELVRKDASRFRRRRNEKVLL